MKKIISILAVALSVALVFVGCSSKSSKTSTSTNSGLKVAVVTDSGGAKDKSFNQSNVETVEKWTKSNGATAQQPIETKSQDKIIPNLETASKVSDVVSIAGFYFEKTLPEVAKKFPDKKYILLDAVVDQPNVASFTFQENEAGYLVGYAAALKSKTGKVGFIGGTKIPPVIKFGVGFVQGAKAANPNIEVFYQYSGTFDDTNKGKTLAATMYDQGADIIFAAAGGAGSGVIKEAQERAINDIKESGEVKHWVIGVDKDQYEDGVFKAKDKEGKEVTKSVILTSAVKRIDLAVVKALDSVKAGTFKGGASNTQVLTIKDDGVGLPEKNPNLSDDVVAKVKKVIEELKSGSVKIATIGDELPNKDKVNGEV
ncbi:MULTISPECIES: BMP family protein [unclassified Gemella]|uniref:BMP family lipoprotein n=1 Tax=unclassified Gemella TaxID=2624949 RepID=UPI001C043407|nr:MULTISPECIES: BMP family ABC transporter substrate-binding protein [unclassified Gemella]MBU0278885.1 BMP family ABC transporter substrate-binding protein [Gemella sp. zg-1178]QWQ38581.1 BMP family ABC transporter substrate-binding protein [Gemella sp. zg-570]